MVGMDRIYKGVSKSQLLGKLIQSLNPFATMHHIVYTISQPKFFVNNNLMPL